MRIFLAGATGVIGRPLVPALVAAGHEVTALTRRPDRADELSAMGAKPIVGDVFALDRLREVVVDARPEVVIQHLTSLPQNLGPRNTRAAYASNDRVRGIGGANLLAAAKAAGARRYLAQNVCFLYAIEGPEILDEAAPLATNAPDPYGRSVRVHLEMERGILESTVLEGLVLRFGFWYGPGTTFASNGYTAQQVRRRRYPVVGNGNGLFPFVHIDDVVAATLAAVNRGETGIYNVCDDEPAPMREWLPRYAQVLGAPRPLRVPPWLVSLVAGSFLAGQAQAMRGVSNAKAKEQLGWRPKYPSWREGFEVALG
jgi:nucleoside-diphosphate-sugar epimerase